MTESVTYAAADYERAAQLVERAIELAPAANVSWDPEYCKLIASALRLAASEIREREAITKYIASHEEVFERSGLSARAFALMEIRILIEQGKHVPRDHLERTTT